MLQWLWDWLFPKPNDKCPDCNHGPDKCRCVEASGW